MKTKVSKRILSVFLAVLMMVTSIPAMAFSAFAAENTEASLRAAMKLFETKMSQTGTTTYTNTLAAYDAYVEAKATLDAVTYGSASVNYANAATKLENAVNAMQPWTPYKGTAVPSFYEDSTGGDYDAVYKDGVHAANLLYSPKTVNSNDCKTIGSAPDVKLEFWQAASTVMLYDGETTPSMPILLMAQKSTTNGRHVFQVYPSLAASSESSTDFAMTDDYWQAHAGKANRTHNWTWSYVNRTDEYSQALAKAGTPSTDGNYKVGLTNNSNIFSRTYYWASAANSLKFIGGENLTGYSQSYVIDWRHTTGDSPNDFANTATTKPIYVINYKVLRNQISTTLAALREMDFANYDEGGIRTVVAAIDSALALDPNSYFTNVTDAQASVKNCADAIKNATEAIKNAQTTANADAYKQMRTAISNSKAAFDKTNNDKIYTDASWSDFETAYVAARNIMANLPSTLYTNADAAATAASNLSTAFGNLDPVKQKVDASSLTAVIEEFFAYDNIFTPESYEAALAVINAAKIAVWGSVENYPAPGNLPDDSEEAQQLVAEWTQKVKDAIKSLRLSMSVRVSLADGSRMSFEDARVLEDLVKNNKSDYVDYPTYQKALSDADAYVRTVAETDFTNFDNQYNEYTAQVQKLVNAYNTLLEGKSFVKLPDGTLSKTGAMITMQDLTSSDNGATSITFSYNNSGVVIKTTHDAATIKYGNAQVKYSVGIKDLDNNMLDSISIHATAPTIGGNNAKNHISGSGPQSYSTPKSLTTDQLETYKAIIDYNNFSLSNIRYTGQEDNWNVKRILTTQDGTAITDASVAESMDLTGILGTTDGKSADPGHGGVFAKSADGSTPGIVNISADLNYHVEATEKQTLTESTVPVSTTYNIGSKGDTYFGAVAIWNCQNFTNWSAYDYVTSATNNEPINTSVTVVDISNLVDLCELCDPILDEVERDGHKYTDITYNAFTKALREAKTPMNYTQLSASQILSQSVTRYNNLYKAYKGLEVKDVNVTFNYKDAAGKDTSTVLSAKYGTSLNKADVDAIQVPQYIVDNYTYTFKGWTPEVSYSPLNETSVVSYTAVYDSVLNKADWDAFNTAKAQLLGRLQDKVFASSLLTSVSESIETLSYFYYTDAQKEATMADAQAAIDAQTATMNSLKDSLVAADLTVDAAKALVEMNNDIKSQDRDRYDLSTFDFTYEEEVQVAGQTVIGIVYDTQTKLDTAIANALNGLTPMEYTVKVNDVEVGKFAFGTTITVNADGQLGAGTKNVAWYYSYGAPSTNNEMTAPKYSKTDVSYEFVVKGNTELTTVSAESDGQCFAVKFVSKAGNAKAFDIKYTDADGNLVMPEAPGYAYFTFSGYSNGKNAGDVINVTADTTIFANYKAKESEDSKYTISFFEGYDSFDFVEPTSENVYSYNELVSLESPDAYCWASASTIYDDDGNWTYAYKLLAYGSSYSFYACQSFDSADGNGLVALSKDDYERILGTEYNETKMATFYDGQGNIIAGTGNQYDGYVYPDAVATVSVLENVVPIYNSSNKFEKFSMIGTFTLPEGYTMVEAGMLFTTELGADLQLENDSIVRMKSSKYTVGNQFVINVKAPASGAAVEFDYCAYAIVKDANGKTIPLYSTTQTGTTAGF